MQSGQYGNKGWQPLILELLGKIKILVDGDPEKYPRFRIMGFGSSLGELTVMYRPRRDEIEDLVDEYAEMSQGICEVCGSKVGVKTLRIRAFYKTLCKECAIPDEEWLKKRPHHKQDNIQKIRAERKERKLFFRRKCVSCGNSMRGFKDVESAKASKVSGLCQKCMDDGTKK